jgi:hypothetical protein
MANRIGLTTSADAQVHLSPDKQRHRRGRNEQGCDTRWWPGLSCERTMQQSRPFDQWCKCPMISMAPGRRINIGEAFGALPQTRIRNSRPGLHVFGKVGHEEAESARLRG